MVTPRPVEVVEVGPRDGLQNERVRISTGTKVRYVEALARAGVRRIEVSSFVHPHVIPQLADAEEVFHQLHREPGVRYSALVPNLRGLERARDAHVEDVAVFTAASDTFVRKNIRMTLRESLEHFGPVAAQARAAGMRVRGYVSTVFGCPYEGTIRPQQGIEIAAELFAMGCYEVSIGDTIGVATPGDVHRWLEEAARSLPMHQLALHFHDTRGTALANVMVGLEHGISVYDGASGGLGGCPFAPGASGNLATEDLVFALHGMGCETGIDLAKLVAATSVIAAEIDHMLPGRYYRAARVQAARPARPHERAENLI